MNVISEIKIAFARLKITVPSVTVYKVKFNVACTHSETVRMSREILVLENDANLKKH